MKRSHLLGLSAGEEQGDEHALDDGEDDGPHQEKVDQGILGRLWHPGGRWSLEEVATENCRVGGEYEPWVPSAVRALSTACVCLRLLPEQVRMCMMRTF